MSKAIAMAASGIPLRSKSGLQPTQTLNRSEESEIRCSEQNCLPQPRQGNSGVRSSVALQVEQNRSEIRFPNMENTSVLALLDELEEEEEEEELLLPPVCSEVEGIIVQTI